MSVPGSRVRDASRGPMCGEPVYVDVLYSATRHDSRPWPDEFLAIERTTDP